MPGTDIRCFRVCSYCRMGSICPCLWRILDFGRYCSQFIFGWGGYVGVLDWFDAAFYSTPLRCRSGKFFCTICLDTGGCHGLDYLFHNCYADTGGRTSVARTDHVFPEACYSFRRVSRGERFSTDKLLVTPIPTVSKETSAVNTKIKRIEGTKAVSNINIPKRLLAISAMTIPVMEASMPNSRYSLAVMVNTWRRLAPKVRKRTFSFKR